MAKKIEKEREKKSIVRVKMQEVPEKMRGRGNIGKQSDDGNVISRD